MITQQLEMKHILGEFIFFPGNYFAALVSASFAGKDFHRMVVGQPYCRKQFNLLYRVFLEQWVWALRASEKQKEIH